tara:strand:+ start:651 stop:1685 length:1035 start_codon:yes stop_codon:yes gene_type:complete
MKLCLIGDLHFGEKGDSEKYNRQILELLEFAANESDKRGVTKCFQFGDYFDNRSRINVETINYALEGAQLLNERFDEVFTIVSNHDIYYRDRLDVTSLKILKPYITVIEEATLLDEGNIIATPWIVNGKQWDDMIKMSEEAGSRFCFGHFELNGFLVNDMYEMEHGYSPKELRHFEAVYTGHYHSPQKKDNIQYLGTPIPITMNEANQSHGIYFLDTDTGDIEFVEYEKVKVVSVAYEDFDSVLDLDPENSYIRVEFPDDLEDETLITDVQNILQEKGFEFKVKYTDTKAKQIMEADVESIEEVENIDAVVMNHIKTAKEIDGIDNSLLNELYQEAKDRGGRNA